MAQKPHMTPNLPRLSASRRLISSLEGSGGNLDPAAIAANIPDRHDRHRDDAGHYRLVDARAFRMNPSTVIATAAASNLLMGRYFIIGGCAERRCSQKHPGKADAEPTVCSHSESPRSQPGSGTMFLARAPRNPMTGILPCWAPRTNGPGRGVSKDSNDSRRLMIRSAIALQSVHQPARVSSRPWTCDAGRRAARCRLDSAIPAFRAAVRRPALKPP
jgi:hypothetical protein